MPRRLSAHERALWARVAQSVRPLPGRSAPPAPAPAPQPAPAPLPPPAPVKPARPAPAPAPAKPAPQAATLDGSWDKRIRRGQLLPDRIVDLHGATLEEAHARLAGLIHAPGGARVLLVITGKGRADRPSRIRAELAHWLERPDLRGKVAALRGAHPRHGGAGAFYLVLKRQG
jgi:DNA-nicking Smr family endonuclease